MGRKPNMTDVERAILFSGNLRFILRNGPIGSGELAKRLGVSTATISKYTLGRLHPSEERIQQIADALGVDVDVLFDDTYAPWKFGEPVDE